MQGYKRAEIKAIVGMHAKQGYTTPRTASTGAVPSNALVDSPADQSINDQAGQRAADVLRLASDFERHATAYDGSYADRLSAAMAKTAAVA